MENGAAAFLRVKVCLIHVTTSREIRKEKQTFTASTWPSPHTVPITPVVFLHHERSGSLTSGFFLAFTASCKDPGNPLNGRKLGDDFRHKKTVSFTCQKNYVLEGARTVTCLNGQWSAKMPICQGEFFRKIMINARSCMFPKVLVLLVL